jgi:hypothetical protein
MAVSQTAVASHRRASVSEAVDQQRSINRMISVGSSVEPLSDSGSINRPSLIRRVRELITSSN